MTKFAVFEMLRKRTYDHAAKMLGIALRGPRSKVNDYARSGAEVQAPRCGVKGEVLGARANDVWINASSSKVPHVAD